MSPTLFTTEDEIIEAGKVVCVGRNYADHAKEMGSSIPTEPVIFLKPSTSLVPGGGKIDMPWHVGRIDHEIELAVIISSKAKNVSREDAIKHIMGYAVILDMTARDIQAEAKSKGLPWTVCKGYDGFAPISRIAPQENVVNHADLDIHMKVNGETRQKGNSRQMIFSPEVLVEYISRIMTLERGDIIATGTPAGVSPIQKGDKAVASIEEVGELMVEFT